MLMSVVGLLRTTEQAELGNERLLLIRHFLSYFRFQEVWIASCLTHAIIMLLQR